jgi:Family of unknown function (DUF5829)
VTAVVLTVFLNYFFVVLDHETYTVIDANAFLIREFAPFERRTTVRNDRSYTGIYFYGTNTYFEFFDASAATNFRKGTDGLALSPEEPGTIQALAPELITRKVGDAQVPWFWAADFKGIPEDSAIDSWMMEYHADFLAKWRPEAARGESGISRRAQESAAPGLRRARPRGLGLLAVQSISCATRSRVLQQHRRRQDHRARQGHTTGGVRRPAVAVPRMSSRG